MKSFINTQYIFLQVDGPKCRLHFELNSQPYAETAPIPSDYPYYTKALTDDWPSILEIYEKKVVFEVEVAYCSLKIQKRVLGYSNIEIGQEVVQGKKVMFDKPLEYEFLTKGLVFRAPRPAHILQAVEDEQYVEMSGFHASIHVIIEGSAMITGGASQNPRWHFTWVFGINIRLRR